MTLLARALYDNNGELPQELSFKRGEILTVIQQNPDGYEGWWICNLRGKVGIAPGNRLDILGVLKPKGENQDQQPYADADTVYEIPRDLSPNHATGAPFLAHLASPESTESGSILDNDQGQRYSLYENLPDIDNSRENEYCLPREDDMDSNRTSGISMTSDFTPSSLSSSRNNFNILGSSNSSSASGRNKLSVRFMDPSKGNSWKDEDAPSDYYNFGQLSIVPPAPPPELMRETSAGTNSTSSTLSARFSELPSRDYGDFDDRDSAISVGGDGSLNTPANRLLQNLKRLSMGSTDSVESKDIPQTQGRGVTLSRQIALERFSQLQQNVTNTSNKLFRFIHSRWKSEESLSLTISVIKPTCVSLVQYLNSFADFCRGVLGNANDCVDRALPKKIWKHLKPLEEHCKSLTSAIGKLKTVQWKASDIARLSLTPDTDYLSLVVNSTRNLSIEVRSLSTTIHGNATLLFPDPSPLRMPTSQSSDCIGRRETAPPDLVSTRTSFGLASTTENVDQEEFRRKHQSVSVDSTNASQRKALDNNNISTVTNNNTAMSSSSSCKDAHILHLYATQINSHYALLDSTLEDFHKCLECSQPPNVFVTQSKFLVKSSTQLVYIANGLCNGLENASIRSAIEAAGNNVCETLKAIIDDTKRAATNFPSPPDTQKLLDTTLRVKQTTEELKSVINEAAICSGQLDP